MSKPNLLQKTTVLLSVATLSAIMLSHAHAVQFYKWLDKNGSTHYTQEHPGQNASKILKTVLVDDTPSNSSPPPAASNEPQNQLQNQPTMQQPQGVTPATTN